MWRRYFSRPSVSTHFASSASIDEVLECRGHFVGGFERRAVSRAGDLDVFRLEVCGKVACARCGDELIIRAVDDQYWFAELLQDGGAIRAPRHGFERPRNSGDA